MFITSYNYNDECGYIKQAIGKAVSQHLLSFQMLQLQMTDKLRQNTTVFIPDYLGRHCLWKSILIIWF